MSIKSQKYTIPVVLLLLFRFVCVDLAPKCVPIAILGLSSCADERAPSGGKRDTVPPRIKYAFPANKSTNFHSDKIKIRFQKFIQTSLDPKEILISPPMEKNPKMYVEGKTLVIHLKSKPKDSTTYTINFGDAIKENNEGVVLKNFTYVFATGPVLDTAKLFGTVGNIADPKDIGDIIVALHPVDSTDGIRRSKPYYFAKTDKNGAYTINNIHPGSYWVYGLKDQNLNYIYDQPNELIGFQDEPITLFDSSKLKNNLVIFESVNSRPKYSDVLTPYPGKLTIYYNSPIKNLKFNSDILSSKDKIELNDHKDTITYWYSNVFAKKAILDMVANDTIIDTARVDLKYLSKDSANNNTKYALTIENQIFKQDSSKKMVQDRATLSPFKSLIIKLSRPVDSINANKRLVLVNDSTGKKDSVAFKLNPDTKRSLEIENSWAEKTPYTLTIPDSTLLDIWGWWNRKMTYKWNSDTKENYGNIILSLKFEHPEKYYVFRILDQEGKIVQTFYYVGNEEKKLTIKNMKAGSYKLQAVDDLNHNGEWDTGDYSKKQQPERIINFKETYELKGNWDLEIEVKL